MYLIGINYVYSSLTQLELYNIIQVVSGCNNMFYMPDDNDDHALLLLLFTISFSFLLYFLNPLFDKMRVGFR